MFALKKNGWKILLAVFISVLVDVILHRLFAPRIKYSYPPSLFIERGFFLPVVSAALMVWFGTLAIIFNLIQTNLSGTKMIKGLRFGIAFAVLCFLAIFEMCLVFGSSLIDELCTSTTDGLSILFLGLLLGSLAGADSTVLSRRMKLNHKSFIFIPLLFLTGRYFGYMFVNIMSAYSEKPIGTFLWTVAIGYWTAVMYWLLNETCKRSPMAQAVRFGVMIFGIYWLIYNSFVLLFLKLSIWNVFLRVIIDVVSITGGVWVTNKLSTKLIVEAN
jgi:hypothetical protein